jgi:hypothetical protein
MALTFLNPSRSYDPVRQRVHFSGHDGMFEIAFSVEIDALQTDRKGSSAGESGYLAAFDTMRDSIHDIARKVYSGNRKSLYVLTARDFR